MMQPPLCATTTIGPSIDCAVRSISATRAAALADDWGGRLVDLGNVGHLNPASGYGEWPRADEFIAELSTQATPVAKRPLERLSVAPLN